MCEPFGSGFGAELQPFALYFALYKVLCYTISKTSARQHVYNRCQKNLWLCERLLKTFFELSFS